MDEQLEKILYDCEKNKWGFYLSWKIARKIGCIFPIIPYRFQYKVIKRMFSMSDNVALYKVRFYVLGLLHHLEDLHFNKVIEKPKIDITTMSFNRFTEDNETTTKIDVYKDIDKEESKTNLSAFNKLKNRIKMINIFR